MKSSHKPVPNSKASMITTQRIWALWRVSMKSLWVLLASFGAVSNAGARGASKPQSSPELAREQKSQGSAESTASDHTIEGQYLVALAAGVNDADRKALWKAHGVVELQKVGSTELYLIEFSGSARSSKTNLQNLSQDSRVRYAEPNLRLKTFHQGEPGAKKGEN